MLCWFTQPVPHAAPFRPATFVYLRCCRPPSVASASCITRCRGDRGRSVLDQAWHCVRWRWRTMGGQTRGVGEVQARGETARCGGDLGRLRPAGRPGAPSRPPRRTSGKRRPRRRRSRAPRAGTRLIAARVRGTGMGYEGVWGMGCGAWGVGCGVRGRSPKRNIDPATPRSAACSNARRSWRDQGEIMARSGGGHSGNRVEIRARSGEIERDCPLEPVHRHRVVRRHSCPDGNSGGDSSTLGRREAGGEGRGEPPRGGGGAPGGAGAAWALRMVQGGGGGAVLGRGERRFLHDLARPRRSTRPCSTATPARACSEITARSGRGAGEVRARCGRDRRARAHLSKARGGGGAVASELGTGRTCEQPVSGSGAERALVEQECP